MPRSRDDEFDRPRRPRRKQVGIAGMPVWAFALVVVGVVVVAGVGVAVAVRAAGRGTDKAPAKETQAGRPPGGPLPDATGAYDQGELTGYLTGRTESDVLAVLGQPKKPETTINHVRLLEFRCQAVDAGTGKRTAFVTVILEHGKVKYLKFEETSL
jgi:hypothetical protein